MERDEHTVVGSVSSSLIHLETYGTEQAGQTGTRKDQRCPGVGGRICKGIMEKGSLKETSFLEVASHLQAAEVTNGTEELLCWKGHGVGAAEQTERKTERKRMWRA